MKIIFSLLIAIAANAHAFTVRDLERTVKTHNVNSIEDLLPLLPEDLKQNFTLQHTSTGLQGASFEFPRVFMFGLDGKMIMTFNGDATQSSFDKLEILEFDDKSEKFNLFEVSLANGLQIQKNPAQCLSCHGNSKGDVRPIFKDYPNWPGFFGSNHDSPARVPKELESLKAFNNMRSNHPRYKHLTYVNRQEGKPEAPFFRQDRFNYESMPNIRLMDYLHWLNGSRISARLREHANYQQWLPLLVYFSNTLDGNSKDELSFQDSHVAQVFSSSEWDSLVNKLGLNGHTIKKQDFYQLFGLSISDFSMEVGPGSNFGFQLGLLPKDPDFVNGKLIADFQQAYPQFPATYQFYTLKRMVPSLIKTDLEKSFAQNIDSYNSLAGIEQYSELQLLKLIRESVK